MNVTDTITQIVGIYLVRNEERFLDQVIVNTYDFCDKLIIVDNRSEDDSFLIAQKWANASQKVELHTVQHPSEAHSFVQPFCGTNTWVFAVDGDELYDPYGLKEFRKEILSGKYDEWWIVFGNVLNCIALDTSPIQATGYLAPPCRSMTKLYNFSAITNWVNCHTERMLGGNITFKDGWDEGKRLNLHEQFNWEDSKYRCLHVCFLQRSRIDKAKNNSIVSRQNPVELQNRGLRQRICSCISFFGGKKQNSQWKTKKYMRGELVEKDVSSFFFNFPRL